ncbi:MAG: DUF547 domain-containing protein [Cyclobacteriaceae bacterium]
MRLILLPFFMAVIGMTGFGQVSHESWDGLLKKHVDSQGNVDYLGFQEKEGELKGYLQLLSQNPPEASLSREHKLAYWINAYNALTVKVIADNYPLKSIKDLNSTISIPGVSTIWDKKIFRAGERELSLNDIEHGILRKEFDEPRIHFAINCASYSCPELRREAYTGRLIEKQLQEQASLFINDPKRNILSKDMLRVSMIFQWFVKDFTKEGTLVDFIKQYATIEIDDRARVKFITYDWSLNE